MRFTFDHLVHFVGNPEKARDELREIGLHAVNGGKHENGGTYNTLSYFDLSYIELIGLFDQGLAELPAEKYSLSNTFQKDHFAHGLSRIALRSQNLEEEARRFKSFGLEVHGPIPLSRKRPDGSVVGWELLFAGSAEDELELPFFIQWDESDDERRRDLKAQQTIAGHNRGKLSLEAVGFAVENAEKTVEKWSVYLNLEKGGIFIDKDLNATGHTLKLTGGDIVFYSPNGEGIVSESLAKRGEKPFLVDFAGGNQQEEFEVRNAIYRFI